MNCGLDKGRLYKKHRRARFKTAKRTDKIFFCLCLNWYVTMRQELRKIFGKELRYLAIETRERLGITQKEMGERLCMSESSYSDIETGKNRCGMPTVMLLLNMQEEPTPFIRGCAGKALTAEEREVETV